MRKASALSAWADGNLYARDYLQAAERLSEGGLRPHLVICADEVPARAEEADRLQRSSLFRVLQNLLEAG
jgi:hypothetical protein